MTTRERIIETALNLFNEQGYHNVSVREIARQLNISPGNLSYHFAQKEDILNHLLNALRSANDAHYQAYESSSKTLNDFLSLMTRIFQSQYNYRGVFIGNQYIMQLLNSGQIFNYNENARRRKERIRAILEDLVQHGHLKASASDIDFLVSFITMFGRFWLVESLLDGRKQDADQLIGHYIGLLRYQLGMLLR